MASKKPSSWTRSIATRRPGSPAERSTTHAFAAIGRKARKTRARLAVSGRVVLAEDLEQVPMFGVYDPVDVLACSPWGRRSSP